MTRCMTCVWSLLLAMAVTCIFAAPRRAMASRDQPEITHRSEPLSPSSTTMHSDQQGRGNQEGHAQSDSQGDQSDQSRREKDKGKNNDPLLHPDCQAMSKHAPANYRVKFDTTAGDFVIAVHRKWAPHGADRFYNLVRHGYYKNNRFYRVISDFMVQWGINGDPEIAHAWEEDDAHIKDDPVKQSNKRGRITFATSGEDSRTTQVFINYRDNASLDAKGFAPFGEVVQGMNVVDDIYAGYREEPKQDKLLAEGNKYLNEQFPKLDYIKSARVMPAADGAAVSSGRGTK